jgi:hypothetical protein
MRIISPSPGAYFFKPMPKRASLESEKAKGGQLPPGAISGSLLHKNQTPGEKT